EVDPGKHVLAIVDEAGKELWRHEFEAAANTQYEFHPALQEPAERASRSSDDDEDRDRRRRRSREDQAAAGAQPDAAAGQPGAAEEPDGSMLDSLAMAEPPTMPSAPTRPAPEAPEAPEKRP